MLTHFTIVLPRIYVNDFVVVLPEPNNWDTINATEFTKDHLLSSVLSPSGLQRESWSQDHWA
jgi:hypothetical protein